VFLRKTLTSVRNTWTHEFCLYSSKALQRLRHPNIVRLYGTSTDDKYDILLLEYVNAGALSMHLRSEAKRQEMTARIRVSILSEVARALHFLHHGGIIDDKSKQKYSILHHDIKVAILIQFSIPLPYC
jgi:serine/threonine protein kinase